MEDNKYILMWIIVSLVVGALGGFYYGKNYSDKDSVEEQPVLEQSIPEPEVIPNETIEGANPFSEIEEAANPFKDTYQNPFE